MYFIPRKKIRILLPLPSSAFPAKSFPKMRHSAVHQTPPLRCLYSLWEQMYSRWTPGSSGHKPQEHPHGPGCTRRRRVDGHRGDSGSHQAQRQQKYLERMQRFREAPEGLTSMLDSGRLAWEPCRAVWKCSRMSSEEEWCFLLRQHRGGFSKSERPGFKCWFCTFYGAP